MKCHDCKVVYDPKEIETCDCCGQDICCDCIVEHQQECCDPEDGFFYDYYNDDFFINPYY